MEVRKCFKRIIYEMFLHKTFFNIFKILKYYLNIVKHLIHFLQKLFKIKSVFDTDFRKHI